MARSIGALAGTHTIIDTHDGNPCCSSYRQPVSRADVEAVRGVGCGELLRQTMERDLVRIVGRSEELGRPYLYGTTKRFLQLFGLSNTDALPAIQWQALQEDPQPEDSNPDELSTSKKDLVVSTTVVPTLSASDHAVIAPSATTIDKSDPTSTNDAAQAVIEDEENGYYDDDDDDADDDDDDWDDQNWDDDESDDDSEEESDDDSDDDDDLDDDDLDEAGDDLEGDESADDDLDDDDDDGGWEEVDDETGDEEFDDDEEEEEWEEQADDDEDWNE